MAFTPTVGTSGLFELAAPFDSQLTPQVVYVCRSVRSMIDCMASGEDPYKRYYEAIGVSVKDYQKDLVANACIVGLQAGTGEWVYVPDSYIVGVPDMNGVKYTSVVLGVSLGPIPDELNLEALKTVMSEAVTDVLGIKPEVKAVIVSQPAMISRDDHNRLEISRAQMVTMSETSFSKARALEIKCIELQKKVKELEDYISKKMF